MESVNERTLACPRCGYNLRGVVETWKDSCPLDGTCSECGLAFAWREILSERVRPPQWCVEVGPVGSLRRTIPGTVLRVNRARLFWRSISMRLPLRWDRLVLLNVALLVAAYVLLCTMSAATTGAYLWKENASQGVTVTADEMKAIATSLVQPWSPEPIGTITVAWRAVPMPLRSPRELLMIIWTRGHIGVVTHLAVGSLVFMPLVFIVLPIARRRAKVRWAHIGRIALYTPAVIFLPLAILFAADAMRTVDQWTSGDVWLLDLLAELGGWLARLIPPALLIMFWWWWRSACRHYLRMQRADLVAISIVLIGVLLSITMSWVLDDALLHDFLERQFRSWM